MGRDNHAPPSSAEVKNGWSYDSAPPICFRGVGNEKLTLFWQVYAKYKYILWFGGLVFVTYSVRVSCKVRRQVCDEDAESLLNGVSLAWLGQAWHPYSVWKFYQDDSESSYRRQQQERLEGSVRPYDGSYRVCFYPATLLKQGSYEMIRQGLSFSLKPNAAIQTMTGPRRYLAMISKNTTSAFLRRRTRCILLTEWS